MTREEAIAILEVSKHMATSGRMYNQAIDMAIEALSNNITESPNGAIKPSNDVINRIDLPEYTSCAFVNYVYATETGMSMGVKSLDLDDLVDGNEVKVLGAEGGEEG